MFYACINEHKAKEEQPMRITLGAREKIKANYQNEQNAIDKLGEARRNEIMALQEYDNAFQKAILSEDNIGKNKESREAYAEQVAWKARVAHDTARIERIKAQTSLEMVKCHTRTIETLRDIFVSGIDPEQVV